MLLKCFHGLVAPHFRFNIIKYPYNKFTCDGALNTGMVYKYGNFTAVLPTSFGRAALMIPIQHNRQAWWTDSGYSNYDGCNLLKLKRAKVVKDLADMFVQYHK